MDLLIQMIAFLVFALFISVAIADVEVLNDLDDNNGENFSEMEQVVPADVIAVQNVKTAHRNLGYNKRVKRQSQKNNGNGGGVVTVPTIIYQGIGDDDYQDTQLMYNETETVKNPTIVLKSDLAFKVNDNDKYGTNLTKDKKDAIKLDLENQLKDLYKYVTGFEIVSVNPDSVRIENGSIVVDYNMTIDPGDYWFKGQNPEQMDRTIVDDFGRVDQTFRAIINLNGAQPLREFPFKDFKEQLNSFFEDPCAHDAENFPCSEGYDQCRVVGDLELECTHRCVLFQIRHPCEHGFQCDLDTNFDPYCAPPWPPSTNGDDDDDLTKKLIIGIVFAAVLIVAVMIGLILWCKRKTKSKRAENEQPENPEHDNDPVQPGTDLNEYVTPRDPVDTDYISVIDHYDYINDSDAPGNDSVIDHYDYITHPDPDYADDSGSFNPNLQGRFHPSY